VHAFLLLLLAIASEVAATTALKISDGMTRLVPTIFVVIGYGTAFWLMSLVLKTTSVGTTYAIWAGLGTAGVAAIGVLWFGEEMGLGRLSGILLIIAGVVVLNMNAPGGH
jgi:small multidrug resistance pump